MASMNALPGNYEIEGFEIVRVLGQGGFGVTYLGFDHVMDKPVAIKEYFPTEWSRRAADQSVIPMSAKAKDNFQWGLDRFLDEARTMAKFDHPAIVRATRHFPANGTAYIIMDFIEGETLEEVLNREGTLPSDQTRYLLEVLLDGLRQAHRLDILHRDIKPSNIIIRTDDGRPIVIDFGAARQAIQKQSAPITAIVTPPYAPHEQYTTQQNRQGPWTDLYSMSVVGYQCLTGLKPPDGPGRIEDDTIQWLDIQAYGDPELCTAINEGLRVPSQQRPGNIDAWLTISGTRYVSAPEDPSTWPSSERVHTRRRDAPPPPFRTRVRGQDDVPRKSSGAIPSALFVGGGLAVAAAAAGLFFVMNSGSIGDADANADMLAVSSHELSRTISDSERPDRFADQPDMVNISSYMPVMRKIPAGSFMMGSSPGSTGHVTHEAPEHRVSIGYDFAMSETEITIGQWRACTLNGPCVDTDTVENQSREAPMKNNPDDYPVRMLKMSQVEDYLDFLTSRTGKTYRLPTEAEWEYAASGRRGTMYPWDKQSALDQANCDECLSVAGNSRVHEVKRYSPNSFGLYDMAGNVWEVVMDCWTENFSSSPTDGSAFSIPGCEKLTIKGGDYLSKLADMRVSARSGYTVLQNGQEGASRRVGFRVVRELND